MKSQPQCEALIDIKSSYWRGWLLLAASLEVAHGGLLGLSISIYAVL